MIIALLAKFGWHLVKISVVTIVTTMVIGAIYFYTRADEHIRIFVEQRLDNHYRTQRVSIRSAQRISPRQIALRGIVIANPEAEKKPTVSIDEMLVKCNTGIDDILQARFSVDCITVRGITLHVEKRDDGTLNISDLFPLPKFGSIRPLTFVENGTLNFIDRRRPKPRTLILKDIDFQIVEQPSHQESGNLITVRGKTAGNELQSSDFVFQVEPTTGAWSAEGTVHGLLITPELRECLPLEYSQKLQQIGSLRCRADLDIQVSRDGNRRIPSLHEQDRIPAGHNHPRYNVENKISSNIRYSIVGKISEGYFSDYRLPFPLTELSAEVHCNESGFKIDKVKAQCGWSTLNASLQKGGHAHDSPWMVQVVADNVHLNQYASQLHLLPEALQQKWQTYQPAGVISLNLDLRSTSLGWEPDIEIRCHNVSLTCPKFPYRFHAGQGTFHWKKNRLDVHLKASASGQLVKIDGEIHDPGKDAWGKIEIHSEDPIPINKTLYDALKKKGRKIVTALNPKGSFMIDAKVERQSTHQPWHQHVLFHLEHCFIQHEACPYPLDKVRGTIEFVNGEWNFRDLVGTNDSGHVTCQGTWRRAATGGILNLNFEGFNIPLEYELRNALQPGAQKIWDALRARGTMDHLTVDFTRKTDQLPNIRVAIIKKTTARNERGQSISIHPTWFPYRMDDFTGRIDYEDGKVTLTKLGAQHGRVRIATNGNFQFDRSGAWQCDFHDLSVDYLQFDRTLVDALPVPLRRTLATLDLQGAMTLNGQIGFQGGTNHPVTSKWDLHLSMADGSLNRGVRFEHIFGTTHIVGQYNGVQLQSHGELDVASMMHRQLQFTQVKGPFWIDNSRLLIGRWSESTSPGQLPRRLTAQILGGTLYGDGEFPFDPKKQFTIAASYSGGDLTKISTVVTQKPNHLSGKAFALLELHGTGQGLHTLHGSGSVRLRDADIYQLPLMVALLKIVKIRPPDRTAFTTSNIQFLISAEHVYFDSIDFHGDAISLKGTGNLNFAGDLDLNFYTKIGREQLKLPAMIRPVLREASRQFMLIHVGGNFDNPQPVREVLPGLNETFQQLFPEEVRNSDRRGKGILSLRSLPPRN